MTCATGASKNSYIYDIRSNLKVSKKIPDDRLEFTWDKEAAGVKTFCAKADRIGDILSMVAP